MNLFNILKNNNKNMEANYIEQCMSDLLAGDDKNKIFSSLIRTLNTMTDDYCDNIYMGKPTKEVYGMSVYLSERQLSRIAENITNLKKDSKDMTKAVVYNKCDYIIEIDPNILNPMYKFTAGELTALLLHEIGHVTADSDFYNDLKSSYQKALFKLKNEDIYDMNQTVTNNIAMIYVLSAIQETHLSKCQNTENEMIADKFVVEMGYGKELTSVMDKFKKIYTSNYINKNYDDIADKEAETCVYLINSFKTRRKYVTDLIKTESKQNMSEVISKQLESIKDRLKKMLIREGAKVLGQDILDESFLDLFSKNPIKVSQNDIDQLMVEIEMIEDYDDKSVVLYKINKRLSQLADAKINLKQNNDYKYNCQCIDGYTKQLNKLLDQVRKVKPVQKVYGVMVKYPKGYEG